MGLFFFLRSTEMKGKNLKHILQQADRLMNLGKVRDAINLLEPLRAEHPQHFRLVYHLGLAYMMAGDLDMALDALTVATTLRPDHVKANTALGFVFARQEDYERALEFFDWSLRLHPNDNETMRGRGGALVQLGRYDEAVDQWKKMGKEADQRIEIQFALARIHEDRREFTKAIGYYHQVLRLAGETYIHEAARERLARIISTTTDGGDNLRMNVVTFCLTAIEQFTGMDRKKLHTTLLELALVGRDRLDVDDVVTTYHVRSMARSFTALQIVSYLYTGFRVMGEVMDVGIDLSKEFEAAYQMWTRWEKDAGEDSNE